jgi:hypothetical protein
MSCPIRAIWGRDLGIEETQILGPGPTVTVLLYNLENIPGQPLVCRSHWQSSEPGLTGSPGSPVSQ